MLKTLCKVALLLLLGWSTLGTSQTAVVLSPVPQLQFFDQNGVPLAFGCVFSFASQTSNQLATFTDHTGAIPNSNPVILSAGGSGNIWLQAGQAYTLIVKSAGGNNCALGTTQYSIDGVGGGLTNLTTPITPVSGSATFIDQSQNQLFTLTLTGNVVGQPISAIGVTPPGLITFEITQDAVGSHTFSWPANALGSAAICSTANSVTVEQFLWDGTNARILSAYCESSGGTFLLADDLTNYGNETIAGTLGVTGATTLSGGGALAGAFSGAATFSGNLIFSGNPNFTGTPTSTTPAANDNSTKIATTAFVASAIANFTQTVYTSAAQTTVTGTTSPTTVYTLPNISLASGNILRVKVGAILGSCSASPNSTPLVLQMNGTAFTTFQINQTFPTCTNQMAWYSWDIADKGDGTVSVASSENVANNSGTSNFGTLVNSLSVTKPGGGINPITLVITPFANGNSYTFFQIQAEILP